jgi:outer membrane protein assembly factor BamB
VWSYPTGGGGSAPAVSNGIVYVGSADNALYALDGITGQFLWKYATNGPIASSPEVINNTVYVGSADGNIYALDATTGALKWLNTTGGMIKYSSPALANGMVYIGSYDHHLYAFDATSGASLWNFPVGNSIDCSPAVLNGIVYVGSRDHKLYAIDAATGTLVWSFSTGDEVFAMPTVVAGMVYVGSYDHHVYALNAQTGNLLWSHATTDLVVSSPTIANGVIYFASSFDHTLHALDATDGHELWSYVVGDLVSGSLTVANGMVFVGVYDGKIYAFRLPTQLTSLGPAKVWIGLKNSDDVGIKFDLLAEVSKENALVASSQLNSVAGGSSGFPGAHLQTLPFPSFAPINFPAGSQLRVTMSVRNACTGSIHNSGIARFWLNDAAADSHFDATIGGSTHDYFLRDGLALTTTVGTGPKKTIDVQAGAKCSAFKPFGTWTITT